MPEPTNKTLYDKIKTQVYKDYPKHSAYRSMMIVKKYKEAGGTYSGSSKGSTTKWLDQKWSSVNDYYHENKVVKCGAFDTQKKFGEYPLCKPLSTIKKLSKPQMKKLIDAKTKIGSKHLSTSSILNTDKFNVK